MDKEMAAKLRVDPNTNYTEIIWQMYLTGVYKGEPLPPVQYREVKQAFFAGLHAAFHEIRTVSEVLPEDTAVQMLEKFQKECEAFAKGTIDRMYRRN